MQDKNLHPDKILFEDNKIFQTLPCCEHMAGNEKFLEKALALQHQMGGAFDITCDLEDGAKVGSELETLRHFIEIIKGPKNKFGMLGIRIHSPQHSLWRRELEEIVTQVGDRVRYITIPKAASVTDVKKIVETIQQLQSKTKQPVPIALHVLIETHGALRDVWEIAALKEVEVLDFGILDFISSHHGAIAISNSESPGQFEHRIIVRAKSEIVAAALAFGKTPSHNITTDYSNTEKLKSDVKRAFQEFGFLRMWSIHPSQIEPIIQGMAPSFREIQEASEIISQALNANWGPISFKDKLHDRASYRFYWSLLKRAYTNNVEIPAQIKQLIQMF